MKRLLFIIFNFLVISYLLFFVSSYSRAVAITATPSATPPSDNKKAQDLLDRVATKVAELAAKMKRSYRGTVKSVGTSSFILTTPDGQRTVAVNDATVYYRIRAGNRTEIALKNLKAGEDVVATGTIDPTTSEMTARQVIAKIERLNIVGVVTAVNKTVYTLKQNGGTETTVDLADALTLKKLDISGKFLTAKLADFKEGSVVFVIAYSSDTKSQTLSSLKALVYTSK